jgi:predicted nucleic acid-binding protein
MKFWDSSAIVPLLIAETSSQRMQDLYSEDAVIVAWWATAVECAGAISRLEREESLDQRAVNEGFRRLTELQREWQEIEPSELLRSQAIRLLRVHQLRASDSLQLAAAIVTTNNRPKSMEFVCLDTRLILAAEREGFSVISA